MGGVALVSDAWDQRSMLPRFGAHADKPSAALAKINEDGALWSSQKALPVPASSACMPVERELGHHGRRKLMAPKVSLARQIPPPSWSSWPTMVGRRRGRCRPVGAPAISSGGATRIDGKLGTDPGPRAPKDLLTPTLPRCIQRGRLPVYRDPANRRFALLEAPDLEAPRLSLRVVRVAEMKGGLDDARI